MKIGFASYFWFGLSLFLVWFFHFSSSWRSNTAESKKGTQRAFLFSIGLVLWMSLFCGLGSTGIFARFDIVPPPFVFLLLSVIVFSLYFSFSKHGNFYWEKSPVYWLIGMQVFRVPVELFLHSLFLEKQIPIQMTYSGYNWDILTGVTAPVVAFFVYKKWIGKWVVALWNVFGLGLLLNIVVISVLSAPSPFRSFLNEPANRIVMSEPFILLPIVLVLNAFWGHLVLFRWLGRSES